MEKRVAYFALFPAVIYLIAAFTPVFAPAYAAELSGYTIDKIIIIRSNVFNLANPEENTAIGRSANRLHIVTEESFIRNELLFREGDNFDQKVLEESERNLRKHDFLTDVKITPVLGNKPKTVDIIVSTRDQWSLLIGGTFGGTSESSESGLDFGEKNLFGMGKSIIYKGRYREGGFAHSYRFKDASLFNTRHLFEVGFDDEFNENRYEAKLQKPFYSLDTKNSYGAAYERRERSDKDLSFNLERTELFYGWLYKLGGGDILRLFLASSIGNQQIMRGGGGYETARDRKVVATAKFLFNPTAYKKERYIEKFRQVEDIPLGTTFTVSLGPVLKLLRTASTELSAEFGAKRIFSVAENDYFFTSITYRTHDDDFNDEYADLELRYYLRRLRYQTFLLHLRASYLESEVNRFEFGGTEGMRGYNTDEFHGKKQLIVNLEDRIYSYKSMFSGIIEPGFVLFTDFGNAWDVRTSDEIQRLKGSFGAGLRIALLKAPGISLIRVDYGRPFDLSRGPVITVGMEGFF
ncbi:MAG: POTRA domain-containing protein [Nitrospinota bacterium]